MQEGQALGNEGESVALNHHVADALLELLNGFVKELRAAGLPLSLTENLDALLALTHIDVGDREAFKGALGTTLVKNHAHWQAFETIFEVYFSLRGPEYHIVGGDFIELAEDDASDEGAQVGEGDLAGMLSAQDISDLLFQALQSGDAQMLKQVARLAVRRFAGMEPNRPVGGTYYLYRTLRNLDLDNLLVKLLQTTQDEAGEFSELDMRLKRDELQQRIDELQSEIEAEIRRRLVADRGVEAMARTLRRPLPEDVDFMHATRDELVSLRKAIYPLTRKLAARLQRKRRHGRRGPLDFRRTTRASLGYGGVPVEPKFRNPRPHKPEIFVLADISGSVAAFARFTLHLIYAISGQFTKVRSFVFIDGLDEVTSYFEGADDINLAVHRVNTEANVVWVDGHSDYGHAFGEFWHTFGKDIGPRTSVIILGDARNNYHAAQSWVVKNMQEAARHVYWLNPEPRTYWDSGDSIVGEYAQFCDGVFEVRNLRQLEGFVANLV